MLLSTHLLLVHGGQGREALLPEAGTQHTVGQGARGQQAQRGRAKETLLNYLNPILHSQIWPSLYGRNIPLHASFPEGEDLTSRDQRLQLSTGDDSLTDE